MMLGNCDVSLSCKHCDVLCKNWNVQLNNYSNKCLLLVLVSQYAVYKKWRYTTAGLGYYILLSTVSF